MPKVALIMGSKSDWPSLRGCVDVLKGFEIEVEVHVASAHRTPETVAAFAANARENGFEAIIAAAGKAAHLAGVIAGHTTLPVIGIPVKSSFMDGLDSLLSTVQMPTGIPVATVAVGGGDNAAYQFQTPCGGADALQQIPDSRRKAACASRADGGGDRGGRQTDSGRTVKRRQHDGY